jgi:PhzF family phenazine biosynthesis protein
MKLRYFHVDAFTDTLFGGNPAGVCLLEEWLPTSTLLKIAKENSLPETAFFLPSSTPGNFEIKWFTPDLEMDLCGHATLATAHVVLNHLDYAESEITFQSNSGELKVKKENNLLVLNFPSRMPERSVLPEIIKQGLGIVPSEVWKSRDYVLVFDNERTIQNMAPNRMILDQINLGTGGIIVTAKGNEVDFVSRFFTPQSTIFEDPVTGSAHCSLIPLWANKTGKKKLTALQISERVGKLFCEDAGERVLIAGQARTYLEGFIHIDTHANN